MQRNAEKNMQASIYAATNVFNCLGLLGFFTNFALFKINSSQPSITSKLLNKPLEIKSSTNVKTKSLEIKNFWNNREDLLNPNGPIKTCVYFNSTYNRSLQELKKEKDNVVRETNIPEFENETDEDLFYDLDNIKPVVTQYHLNHPAENKNLDAKVVVGESVIKAWEEYADDLNQNNSTTHHTVATLSFFYAKKKIEANPLPACMYESFNP